MAERLNGVSQQNCPAYLLDALYCTEEKMEGGDGGKEEEEEEDRIDYGFKIKTPVTLLEQDCLWADDELVSLLSKELPNELHNSRLSNPSLVAARREAVEWMLKVNARFSFSALTAVLAIDYLDRFMSTFYQQRERPWMTQLVAVACISLASKVEETQVPLLLDLQVEGSRFMFEAKTIKRMEILVLSTLQWRMNPVTPLSFLDYFTRSLGLKPYLCCEFLKRCERTLISAIVDSRLTSYLPSVIATATMLSVVNSIEPCLGLQFENQLLGIVGVDKDKVDSCYTLLMEAFEGDRERSNKRKFRSSPGSPNGVMDLSLSSDWSSDSWSLPSSVSSSPEPLSKKLRPQDQTTAADFLSIPR